MTADRLQPRLLLRIGLLLLLSPWLLAVGAGIPNRAAGRIDGWLHQLLFFTSDVIPFVEEALSAPLPAIATVVAWALVLVALRQAERRLPASLLWLPALPEALLAAAALVAAAGLFAVGCGIDRWLFWAGLLTAALFPRAERAPPGPAWSDPANQRWRLVVLATGIGLVLLAGVTLLEGPGQHSPPFRLRDLWLAGPGRSPWLSGGVWLLLGASACTVAGWRWCSSDARALPRWPWRLLPGLLVVVVVLRALSGPDPHQARASAVSAVGLLLLVSCWPLVRRWIPDVRARFDLLDPRRLLSSLLPLLFWSALCAARGLTCFMWTVPADLPPEVERIADVRGAFSLAVEPRTGAVLWSERDRHEIGVVHPDGGITVLPIDGPDAPEEVFAAPDGRIWASLAGEETSGIVAIDPVTGPRWPGLALPTRCWISGFFELPGQAAAAAGLPLGTTLAGCEQGSEVWLLTPDLAVGRVMTVPEEVEQAAFSGDGGSLYLVGLWAGSSVWRLGWPELRTEARRTIGGFNWGVVADDARQLVWVTRFFEGTLLALDGSTLEPRHRVPLSFGPRAMIHEPVHDLLWISSAYSGRLWAVDPSDPSTAVSWALCGQGRALASDAQGRVIVATDCGIFRLDLAWNER